MKFVNLTLLLILLLAKIQAQDKSFRPTYNYDGYLQISNGKKLPIRLNFLVLLDSSIVGSYNYNPQNGRLKLAGIFHTDYSITFFEWDIKGHNTGRFDGQVSKDRRTITGIWKSGDKKHEFPFSLSSVMGMKTYWDYIKKYRSLKEYHNIDSAIKHKDDVVSIDVANQQLNKLPQQLSKLPNVISTNILGNRFKTFPIVITKLSQLEEISFASNDMHYVGPEIGRLKNLKILILDFNSFPKLPIQIGELTNLLYLDVSMNKNLKSLPSSITNLKQLQELHIERTSISNQDIRRIKACLPNCVVVTD
jgi:Leucine-rich repeat (LRR) protein